ncbi:MAG: alpha/beta hydrolase [Ancalomicrobiaceae bacterium]|nr:alpha/beta hydrolase [Ancalomicrobiaceae bacterium]
MSVFDHPENSIPDGVVAGFIEAEDGRRLRVARWVPPHARDRGTVCIFQGRAEFIEKYFETVRDLIARGYAVATFDWRGQGGSERPFSNPKRGHVDDFGEFALDLDAFMTQVVLSSCPPPYYALAHSTGGLVLLQNSMAMRTRFRRYVLAAPFLGLGQWGVSEGTARALTTTFARIGLGRLFVPRGKPHSIHLEPFEGNRLTGDERRYMRNRHLIETLPDLSIGAPTIGWLRAALKAAAQVTAADFAERVRIPTLIVASTTDRVVSTRATEHFAMSSKNCFLVLISGAEHELLQEREAFREQFWAAFDAFVPGS